MRDVAPTLALVLMSVSASSSAACTVTPANDGRKKLTVEADCAFKNAGYNRHYIFEGDPVVDFGNGRVGQRFISGGQCLTRRNLFLMDCSTGDAIVIGGKRVGEVKVDNESESPETGQKIVTSQPDQQASNDLILEPLGPVRIDARTTVADVMNMAKKYNYRATSNINHFVREHARYKRRDFDYTCGCKLYYPDSPGAKL